MEFGVNELLAEKGSYSNCSLNTRGSWSAGIIQNTTLEGLFGGLDLDQIQHDGFAIAFVGVVKWDFESSTLIRFLLPIHLFVAEIQVTFRPNESRFLGAV